MNQGHGERRGLLFTEKPQEHRKGSPSPFQAGFLPAGMGSPSKVGSGVFAERSSSREHLHQLLCWIRHGMSFGLRVNPDGTGQARCPQAMAHRRERLAPVPLLAGILLSWERLAYGEATWHTCTLPHTQLSWAKRIPAPFSDGNVLTGGEQQEWPGAPRSFLHHFLIMGSCLQEQSQGMTQTPHPRSASEAAQSH